MLAKLEIESEIKKLDNLITEWIGPDRVIQEGNIIFVQLRKIDDEKEFLLKVCYGEEFPLVPADYIFVNPETKNDDSPEHWPVYNQDAFKTAENPRWICIAGTLAYKKHHTDHQFNPKINSLNQTVFHIFREINGWKRNE
jgi:hypothetical protein